MATVAEVIGRRGGTSTFADLRALVTARAVRNALAAGEIRRVAKGVYALPDAPPALTAARSQGCVEQDELLDAATRLRGPYRRRVQHVAALADGRAESVLESVLRSLLIEHGIEGFVPQVVVQDAEFSARLDLGHQGLLLDLEADGFEHHGSRRALVKDCRRQVNLTIRGWRVLRFSWEDIMYDPGWVVATIERAIGLTPLSKRLLRAA